MFNERSLSAMTELIGIGVGRAGEVLNTMLGSHVRLSVPTLREVQAGDLTAILEDRSIDSLSAVEMEFTGDFSGCAELVFTSADASRLVDVITAEVSSLEGDLDSIRAGTLCEVGNIVLNAILGTIVNEVRAELVYSVPIYLHGKAKNLLLGVAQGADIVILVSTRFEIESILVDGDIAIFLSLETLVELEHALFRFANG
ncbi:MAG: chemotaxis protein CheC [Spirochaetota bacterium]